MERGPLVSRTKMHGVQLQYKLMKGMHEVSRGSCLVAVILVGAEVGVHSDGRGLGRRHISVSVTQGGATAMMVWLP